MAGAMAGAAALSLAACGSSATSTTAASTASAASSPAASATSESSCSVDCTNPIATGASAWAAQVQAPLQEVLQDLSQISADASGDPASLTVDGAQLSGDAQAVLNDEIDPAPAGNSDFVAAMNDYIAAGNDYSGDNSSGQQNVAQAAQEVAAGNAAVNSFEAANPGSNSAIPATTVPASSAPVTSATASGTTNGAALWCGPVIDVKTAPSLAVWETGNVYVNVIPGFKAGAMAVDNPATPAAAVLADSGSICSSVLEAHEGPPPADLAQYNMALTSFLKASEVLHTGAATYAASLAKARVDVNSGLSELNAFLKAIGK